MDVLNEVIEAESEGTATAVLRKRPAGTATAPTVVMFHDGPGIRGATHEFAINLASQGFEVLVPDLYHRHGRMLGWELHEREADPTIVDRLWELLGTLTDAGIQADLDDTLATAGVEAHRDVATIGFCVGARAVFPIDDAASRPVRRWRHVASVVPRRRPGRLAPPNRRRDSGSALHRHRRGRSDATALVASAVP